MTDEQDAGPVMPAALAELLREPGWSKGTFGDAYREIGQFRVYVYPGTDMVGQAGWEVVVSYHRLRGMGAAMTTADLHAASDLVRQLEHALAGGAAPGAGEAVGSDE